MRFATVVAMGMIGAAPAMAQEEALPRLVLKCDFTTTESGVIGGAPHRKAALQESRHYAIERKAGSKVLTVQGFNAEAGQWEPWDDCPLERAGCRLSAGQIAAVTSGMFPYPAPDGPIWASFTTTIRIDRMTGEAAMIVEYAGVRKENEQWIGGFFEGVAAENPDWVRLHMTRQRIGSCARASDPAVQAKF